MVPMRFTHMTLLVATLALIPAARLHAADDAYGAEVYTKNCAQCHDQATEARVPPRSALEKMTAAAVNRALETGVMREMGSKITLSERIAVAAYLGKAAPVKTDPFANRCAASTALTASSPSWSGWGAGLNNWRFQNAAGAGLSAADVPKLKLKWAFGVPEATSMRSQPAVYGGRVFLAGPGEVYSLDAKTGCVHWAVNAAARIRSGLAIAPLAARTLVV